MPPFRLHRRHLLKGAAGIAVGLPALELMSPTRAYAQAAGVPKRFVIAWGGTATGTQGTNSVTPATLGAGYAVGTALKPLTDLSVRDEVTVVSGLKVPWAELGPWRAQGLGAIPPGGKSPFAHHNTYGPQLAGTRSNSQNGGSHDRPKGPTADQVVASTLASATSHRVLSFRVQTQDYFGLNADLGYGSWELRNGNVSPVTPVVSPAVAFDSLFSNARPSAPDAKATARLQRRRSVLDFVGEATLRLVPRLGSEDRLRVQRHFEEIRALERKLASTEVPVSACLAPARPGADPGIAGSYSNEDLRGQLLTDLIAMAFACDLSRVANLLTTHWICFMNMRAFGQDTDMHNLSHGPPAQAHAVGIAFCVRQFARLVQKLKALPEVGGGTVLDHTAMVLLFEHGVGWDPEGLNGGSSHSTENMNALVAGRAGGLKAGHHIRALDQHPAQVVISAMEAVGAPPPGGKLGDISGNVPGLFA